jgi:hypothetical protein
LLPVPQAGSPNPNKKEIDLLPLPTIGAHSLGSNPVLTFGYLEPAGKGIAYIYPLRFPIFSKPNNRAVTLELRLYLFIYLFISIL